MITFEHRQAAHCENGAVSNLLNFHGLDLSEPMVFGIGSGLFFSYIPFVKLNGLPASAYRILPGQIFKRVTKRTGVEMEINTFRDQDKAMHALDAVLDQGMPAGVLSSVFYLPYLPEAYRFHFNAHNIVIYGKEGDEYLVSDPVLESPTRIHQEDLKRARFAKGTLAPRGRMYYPTMVPKEFDIENAIKKGIRRTAVDMLTVPVPYFGLKGMATLAGNIRKWPRRLPEKKARLYLGNLIRMQEEIGTGGAGFRFIFAAFLQEASAQLGNEELMHLSKRMTETGDLWREFAYKAGRLCKNRETAQEGISFAHLSDLLLECKKRETDIFKSLRNAV